MAASLRGVSSVLVVNSFNRADLSHRVCVDRCLFDNQENLCLRFLVGGGQLDFPPILAVQITAESGLTYPAANRYV